MRRHFFLSKKDASKFAAMYVDIDMPIERISQAFKMSEQNVYSTAIRYGLQRGNTQLRQSHIAGIDAIFYPKIKAIQLIKFASSQGIDNIFSVFNFVATKYQQVPKIKRIRGKGIHEVEFIADYCNPDMSCLAIANKYNICSSTVRFFAEKKYLIKGKPQLSENDLKFILYNSETVSDNDLMQRFNLSLPELQMTKRRLGIRIKSKAFSEYEIQIITDKYVNGNTPIEDVAALINRTPDAIRIKVNKLGLGGIRHTPRTEYRNKYISEHYPHKSNSLESIAEHLGITIDTLKIKASELGVRRNYSVFTESEKEKMKDLHLNKGMSCTEITNILGSKYRNVLYFIKALKAELNAPLSFSEQNRIYNLYVFGGESGAQIADKLGKPKEKVLAYIKENKLKKGKNGKF